MFNLWFKNWRRRRLVHRPIPAHWPELLARGIWYWQVLSPAQKSRLLKLIAIFIHEKEIVVPPAIGQPEQARVVVAGAACLMLLGFEDWYCFDRVETVILDTRHFDVLVSPAPNVLGQTSATGVYSKGSPIRLAWPEVRRQCESSAAVDNVVIHEFAHHIDDLDGALAGDPPFQSRGLQLRWQQIAEREMRQLELANFQGAHTILDPYGLESPVEFFAVSCEAFFCQPQELQRHHRELFELLTELFRLDPRPWFQV